MTFIIFVNPFFIPASPRSHTTFCRRPRASAHALRRLAYRQRRAGRAGAVRTAGAAVCGVDVPSECAVRGHGGGCGAHGAVHVQVGVLSLFSSPHNTSFHSKSFLTLHLPMRLTTRFLTTHVFRLRRVGRKETCVLEKGRDDAEGRARWRAWIGDVPPFPRPRWENTVGECVVLHLNKPDTSGVLFFDLPALEGENDSGSHTHSGLPPPLQPHSSERLTIYWAHRVIG